MAYLWVTLLGSPGAGKTTVGQTLSGGGYPELGVVHYISGSRLLDDYIAAGREGSREIKAAKDRGEPADPALTHRLLNERIEGLSGTGVVLLDGFPKSLAEVGKTEELLSPHRRVDLAILLTCAATQRAARIADRLMCNSCKLVTYEDGEAAAGQWCRDAGCGGTLTRRLDDDPKVLKHRERGEPVDLLAGHYSEAGRLVEVDANRPVEDVVVDVLGAIVEASDRTSTQTPG